MKNVIEIDYNESIHIEVESSTGWDKEKPHRQLVNIVFGNIQLNNLIEEDAELLYHQLDLQLHDETFEKLEIKYQKALEEIDYLKEKIYDLENDIDCLKNRRG